MPSRLRRIYGLGDFHFITGSCYRRQPLLGTRHAREVFLRIFEQVRRKYKFEVVGYVVMPEHFHILIGEPMCTENRRCENRRTGTPDIKEQTRTEMTRIPLSLDHAEYGTRSLDVIRSKINKRSATRPAL